MPLAAVAQKSFPFAGKQRERGERIEPEELAQATAPVRRALVNSGHLVLVSGDSELPEEAESASYQAQLLRLEVDEANGKLDAALAVIAELKAEVDALRAAQTSPRPELIEAIKQVVNAAAADALAQAPKKGGKGQAAPAPEEPV